MCFFNPFAEIDFDSFPTKEALQQQCKHFYPVYSYSEHPCLNLDVSNGGKYLIKILFCKKQSALHYDYLFLFISFHLSDHHGGCFCPSNAL